MNKQTFRFICIGILNTIVGYGIFYVLLSIFDFYYPISLFISHLVGVLHSYFWNSKWTFEAGKFSLNSLFKFSQVYIVTFVVNLGMLYILVDKLHWQPLVSQAFCLFITTCISFFGHKYYSFKKKRE